MMITKVSLIGMSLLALSACASGPTRHEIHAECRLEMDAARTAVQLRDKGKDKRAMLQTLPPLHPNSTRLLRQMYQIVDEAYAFPDLNEIVYGIYRYEHCARQLRHQREPSTFAVIHAQLQACQARFGRKVSKQAVACVRAVFPSPANTLPGATNPVRQKHPE